jgi:hypothetical protein
MLVQPRAGAGLGRGLKDDRYARIARELLEVLGPVLTVVSPVCAADDQLVDI